MDAASDGMRLPYDVLLDILRRLPGRDVCASQCVCRAWRDIVNNDHWLSLERYFPRRAFPGLFVNKTGCRSNTSFFAPPANRGMPGFRSPVYPHQAIVYQSCNGLLLLEEGGDYILNPVTARYTRLPQPSMPYYWHGISLAFDPAVSFHYHVFRFPEGGLLKEPLSATITQGEVPPLEEAQAEEFEEPLKKVLSMLMYSSCTGHWEDREFTPGLCASGHLYDMVSRAPESYEGPFHSSNYWRGSVYMHCHNSVLVILHPSKGTYDMVQLPGEPCGPKSWYSLPKNSVLASYERGVHYVVTNNSQLRVWMLTELTNGQLGWELVHDAGLNLHGHMIRTLKIQPKMIWRIVGSNGGPVSLSDYEIEDDWATPHESEYSWDSDEDNYIDMVGGADHHESVEQGAYCRIMGFHPHKNALILALSGAVVVYHLDTSRMQYLGDEDELDKDNSQHACCVEHSFIYRPCYKDMLPRGKLSMPPQNDIRSNST
ncbi:hypothetical protein CFC21_044623 [Triticum aestivum]|uniref:F-box domain-containing protein n=2 Tax=Triticum aestivum TaxID=4565 RepID=A0A3B6FYP2_WHEAT|nr:uncharacterized protein LOC123066801 [Triticum aestivum]KAF7033517.1 hypothetical protein CFC21_044600 [Triticum aestivum]KAF7033540.1 hypothetical protein CFC21_044623 [Triticum aestivum]CDM86737.1 unnamed protein product [Triticum aestivum]